jgi:hypothetical protein
MLQVDTMKVIPTVIHMMPVAIRTLPGLFQILYHVFNMTIAVGKWLIPYGSLFSLLCVVAVAHQMYPSFMWG